jgi:hypothetical protein
MDTDFLIYIKSIGIAKAKENLKISLNEAVNQENWELVKKISEFLNIYLNEQIEDIKNINIAQFNDNNIKTEFMTIGLWNKLKDIICDQLEILGESVDFETVVNQENVVKEYNSYLSISGSSSWSFYGSFDLEYRELIMAVEEEFDIEISDEVSESITIAKDLYDVINDSLSAM